MQNSTKKIIENLAEQLSLNVRRDSKTGEWFYFENGVWLQLGKNDTIAKKNLREWSLR